MSCNKLACAKNSLYLLIEGPQNNARLKSVHSTKKVSGP